MAPSEYFVEDNLNLDSAADPRNSLLSKPLASDSLSDDGSDDSLIGSNATKSGPKSRSRCCVAFGTALPILVLTLISCAAFAHALKVVPKASSGQELEVQQEFDVIIIGAGAAGLAAAKELRKTSGLKVRLSMTQSQPWCAAP